ncbi:MAG: tyrosine--tRNA ligase [Phenylobacterium sp.]|jgi:tyrosyl-tRNA synthetase|uniref:tyrosine--tRNA ligase n=1 Tax=Phenylobacterium sp. TaxID=1871053 RepID=UPI0025F87A15|nr:tyrosine--tRNA ligase [Phenylobacterium sp.]MCA3714745.1 tyrosine--tRNA ligase [Phenylobacterium sp.]MCA3732456.1 tyrosine--tRNA ligase [Phenylobacterium sp.]MCA3745493.1 tyrosine--tRNA ligase [Phenylobacterium sp.]MCA6272941.1 tyrosine--tRNA ligase [Phenylobacterium sp.]MCA6276686.1 tyrosine--tRNA ligase [Phenylobacterium sp.]
MTPQAEFTSDLLRTLQARGYIHQITHPEELDAAAAAGRVTGYIGFDATAPSLHVGSLLQIMMLRRMQQAGHKPIVLMGGGTTKVGDPTDKDQSRPLLTEERIQANIDSIKTVFARFLTFGDGPTDAVLVNNADWLDRLGYVEFLRNYGVHFTINRMLSFDSVRLRLEREQPMTFLEFNYMLMQATDFLELERKYGCQLQMGGSDQWGNILNGVELIRRVDHKQAFGLTSPLLSTASGQKMGKTVAGAVWLNADMLSPYDYWQFWRNTEDADVGRFLRLFTDLPLDEIARLEGLTGAGINDAKKVLATEATRMLHGAEAAAAAEEAARVAFEAGGLSEDMPTLALKADDLAAMSHAGLMVAAGFAASNSEARKQIANGGFRINGEKVSDPQATVVVDGAETELRSGKRRVRLVIEP